MKNYIQSVADWREVKRANARRSIYVLAGFMFTYLALGYACDFLWWNHGNISEVLFLNVGFLAFLVGLLIFSVVAIARSTEFGKRFKIFVGGLVIVGTSAGLFPLAITMFNEVNLTSHSQIDWVFFPFVSVIALCIALFSILIAVCCHRSLVLMGTLHQEITEDSTDAKHKQLFNLLTEMRIAAGVHYQPKLFVIDAPYMNAFASGWREKDCLIVVTSALLEKLDRAELQAVLAHELCHIRHGDTKLILYAVVLSSLIVTFIDILYRGMLRSNRTSRRSNSSSNSKKGGGAVIAILIAVVALRFILPILTALLQALLSRSREYMADAGCIELMRDNKPLADALIKIDADYKANKSEYKDLLAEQKHEIMRAQSYLHEMHDGETKFDPAFWFSSHPQLDARLQAIGYVVQAEDNAEEADEIAAAV